MPPIKDSESDYMISETGNWNVADSFAKIKIMKPLALCDVYEDVALYGYESFVEELVNYGVPVDELRIRGMKRLLHELIRITKNTKFAMRKPGTKKELEDLGKKLYKIRDEIFEHVYQIFTNQAHGTSGVEIVEPLFSKTLEALSKIKADINFPLNKNHLIFTDKEEFDPKAFKDRIRDRIVNKG